MNENRQGKHAIVHDGPSPARVGSFLLTMLTVLASMLTIAPLIPGLSSPSTMPSAMKQLNPVPPAVRFAPAQPELVPAASEADSTGSACILAKESISAKVSGCTARVTIKQRFVNPNRSTISATYSLPLSDTAAVDGMTMQIGKRIIAGVIKKSEEARQIYEAAKMNGFCTSLLEQKRTNIFSQSVANVKPHETIDITVSYSEMVPYSHGQFTLVFPTAVGPRFVPVALENEGAPAGHQAEEQSSLPEHLSVDVALDEGGIPIVGIASPSDRIVVDKLSSSCARMSLKCSDHRQKGDVVFNWQMAEGELETGYLTHKDGQDGFLSAMILPPQKVQANKIAPREMIFIVDCSGSQQGPPLEKAKDTLHYIVDRMTEQDTVQILAFNQSLTKFAGQPQLISDQVKRQAHRFIDDLNAQGGTVMMPAVEAACSEPIAENRLRIVTIMTDGFIDNDYDVIGLVKRLRGTSRWFSFGTGNSVNRTLIDGIAKEGGGEPEYVPLDASGKQIAQSFYERISSPVLTNVQIKSEGIALSDIYPKQVSDVWEQRPLYFQARYKQPGSGNLVVSGFYQGKPYTKRLKVELPERQKNNAVIAQNWARAYIDDLMSSNWHGMQTSSVDPDTRAEIIQTSLDYHVLSQFTALVAVDSAVSAALKKAKEAAEREANLSKSSLPPLDPFYESLSPTNVVLGAGAATSLGFARGAVRLLGPVVAVAAIGAGAAMVFGYARGALQCTVSQSFSTVVTQLNALNVYSASPAGVSSGAYPPAFSLRLPSMSYPASFFNAPASATAIGASGTGGYFAPGSYRKYATGLGSQAARLRNYAASSNVVAAAGSGQRIAAGNGNNTAASGTAAKAPRSGSLALAAPGFRSATNGASGPIGSASTAISGVNAAASVVPRVPYLIAVSMPSAGVVDIDLQLVSVLVQWLWFIVAVLSLPLSTKARESKMAWQRLGLACVAVFISFNALSTMHWLLQFARNANLV